MTIQEISILRQNGEETTLTFSENGVLKKSLIEGLTEESKIETHFFRKNPERYVEIISQTLKRENINDAIAISGIFKDDDGSIIEQEGLLGNIFYTNTISKAEETQGE